MITKRTFIDQITVDPTTGHTSWRETTVIEENGAELSRAYHRSTVSADELRNDLPAIVAQHRAMVATPEKATEARERREAELARMTRAQPVEPIVRDR